MEGGPYISSPFFPLFRSFLSIELQKRRALFLQQRGPLCCAEHRATSDSQIMPIELRSASFMPAGRRMATESSETDRLTLRVSCRPRVVQTGWIRHWCHSQN